MKLMLLLVAAFAVGTIDGTSTTAERSLFTSTGIRCNDADEPPRLLAVYERMLVAGCTPVLEKFADGTVVWDGCPTWNCPGGPPPDECQMQPGSGGDMNTCKCLNQGWGGVLCQGVVEVNGVGLVVEWDCFDHNCPGACTKVLAPGAPGRFYACDC